MDKIIAMGILWFFMMVVGALVSMLAAIPVMICWNYAVVNVFHAPEITWGQTWCLLYIVSSLKTTFSAGSN